MQKKLGITCSSYGTYFKIGRDEQAELEKYIRAAKMLGTNVLRLWCGTKGSASYSEMEKSELFVICRELAHIAEKNGVTLCMECHNGTMTDDAQAALELMTAVNSPYFRMYYQPNQFRSVDENLEYAMMLAPYTEHIHVFNWEGVNRYPLCDGITQWRRYLSAFEGDHAILLEFMPDDKIESLPAEANALFALRGEA